jgi:hypothetical protein
MITASSFRDKFLSSITISYDWQQSEHSADICVTDHSGVILKYQIAGLVSYDIFEDFQAMHISQCTLLVDVDRVYLSLDPYTEGTESDQDCFKFIGSQIKSH